MRLILMGTGPFAVPSFQALLEAGHEILHVVTRPTVPQNGKKEASVSPVRLWANVNGLPLTDPISINSSETLQWLIAQHADLLVVCDYGQILSRDALMASRLGGINLHGSVLPRHRGAAPVQWSILSGDSLAGVSIIHMTPALDGGPVLHGQSIAIGPTETAETLEEKLSQIGVPSMLESVAILESKTSLEECTQLGQNQDKSLATKAPRLTKEDGELNLHYPVRCIDRLIRGLKPWPGTFANLSLPDGKSLRVIVPQATPIECDLTGSGLLPGNLLYGASLLNLREAKPSLTESLYIAAVDGLLAIPALQPAGKRLMSAEEFLRGYARYPNITIQGIPGSHPILNKMLCT